MVYSPLSFMIPDYVHLQALCLVGESVREICLMLQ